MFGFPIKFILHLVGWPLGWVVLTLIWAYREDKKDKLEDEWIAENIINKR